MQYVINEFGGQCSNDRHGSMEYSKWYVCHNEQPVSDKRTKRFSERQHDNTTVDDQQQPVRSKYGRCDDQYSDTCEYGECWQ